MRYACCDERRLQAVKDAGQRNGIEYVEVSDSEAPDGLEQRTLFVRLLKGPAGLSDENVLIEGGDRFPVAVEWAKPAVPLPPGEDAKLTEGLEDAGDVLLVRTDSRGDFSLYTLRLVVRETDKKPPADFDPLLASVEFSFKVECPTDLDCLPACDCPPEPRESPAIDYLAKDFQSFRSLMLDRLSLLAPGWTERSTPDVGIALVELLAYVADELSYRQDAVATEAYLQTARRRTSLRRHARLVDYVVHEGANARAWVRAFVDGEGVVLERGTPLLTRVPGLPDVIEPDGEDYRDAIAASAEPFETLDDEVLFLSHERFDFWTWGDVGCCLPRGATSATLVGLHPELKAGDVLVLAEVAGPLTGKTADADPAKRAAVRLTHVYASNDPSGGLFGDSPDPLVSVDVTEIEWDEADALPFPLCISVEERPELVVAEAWGNIVLVDHGRTIAGEPLGEVPDSVLTRVGGDCDPCDRAEPARVPIRFRPTLVHSPMTHARAAPLRAVADGPLDPALQAALASLTFEPVVHDWLDDRGIRFEASAILRGGHDIWSVSDGVTVALLRVEAGMLTAYARPAAAGATLAADPRAARPAVVLDGMLLGAHEPWTPQLDLLGSNGDAPEFVVEVEHDGAATLRFGDGVHGRRPDIGSAFAATYRVGNGTAGNVGIGAIAHVASTGGGVTRVVNPIAAAGGVDPEAADAIRRDAPEAYFFQQRAVTEGDYAEVSERNPAVQRAKATFRWTGSWHTVFVTADAVGGRAVDETFERGMRAHLEPFRMAGYDLEVDAPRFVPLEVALHVCVEPDHFRAHVRAAVLDVLSSRARADGTLGFFHPDRFSFGEAVYLSAIVAAVQAVPGVQSVVPITFQRQHVDASSALGTGVLIVNRLEIARLDNDRNFPDRGVLSLSTGGGK